MAQHKQSLRKSLRSALSHKKLADDLLDSIVASQTRMQAIIEKLDANTSGTADTDFAASLPSTQTMDADAAGTLAQHKASLRKSLRSAIKHKALADDMLDSLEELEVAMDALVVKLDAEAGVIDDGDYVDTLSLVVDLADSVVGPAQNKASRETILRSGLSHKRLADVILSSIGGMQSQMNAALALCDAGFAAGDFATAGIEVPTIDPEGL